MIKWAFLEHRRTDAQVDVSLPWSHKSYCRFCRALAQYGPCNISIYSIVANDFVNRQRRF